MDFPLFVLEIVVFIRITMCFFLGRATHREGTTSTTKIQRKHKQYDNAHSLRVTTIRNYHAEIRYAATATNPSKGRWKTQAQRLAELRKAETNFEWRTSITPSDEGLKEACSKLKVPSYSQVGAVLICPNNQLICFNDKDFAESENMTTALHVD